MVVVTTVWNLHEASSASTTFSISMLFESLKLDVFVINFQQLKISNTVLWRQKYSKKYLTHS